MLTWIRSPRGSTATATVVAVILALYWLAPWQKPLPPGLRLPFASLPPSLIPAPAPSIATAPTAAPGAAAGVPAGSHSVVATAPALGSGSAGETAPTTPQASAAAAIPSAVPAFDVVRVEPTGESVIAGRAAPGSEVALLDGETVIGHVRADQTGQFALMPPPLSEGSHYLSLRAGPVGQEPVRSAQGVAVSVASNGATKPLVVLLSPDKPVDILSDGVAPATSGAGAARPNAAVASAAPAAGTPVSAASPVAIQSVQAGQNGNFLAAGVAHPGSQCRVYLNGAYLADVTAGRDGKWSVEIKKGMQPGRYTVRADELDPAGAVSHRVEVPFEYPSSAAAGRPKGGAKRLLLSRDATTPAGTPQGGPSTTDTTLSGRATPSRPAVGSGTVVASAGAAAGAPSSGEGAARAGSASPSGTTAAPAGADTAAAPPPAAAVIPDLHTTTVIRGDSLWRISRKMLGHGIEYTEIYASNANQIRDPALIFPGQIFVVPSKHPNG